MNGGGTITVWDSKSGAPVSVLPASSVSDVEFSPDGQRLLTVSEDHTRVVWDAERARAVAEFLGAPGHLWLGRFSPDGSRVVTAGSDLAAWQWVIDPGAPIAVFTESPGGDREPGRSGARERAGCRRISPFSHPPDLRRAEALLFAIPEHVHVYPEQ